MLSIFVTSSSSGCRVRIFCSQGMYVVSPLVDNISYAQELTNDRLVSEADLTRLLGTLRYLQGLKVARQKVEVGAADTAEAAADHTSASISHSELLPSSQIAFIAKRFHKLCEHTLASAPGLVHGTTLPYNLALLSVAIDSAACNLCRSIHLVLTPRCTCWQAWALVRFAMIPLEVSWSCCPVGISSAVDAA